MLAEKSFLQNPIYKWKMKDLKTVMKSKINLRNFTNKIQDSSSFSDLHY